jgi:protein phosphatase
VAGATATGERPTNQDHYHHDRHLLVVADGVAGRPAGKLAAELTVHTVTAAGRDQEFAHTMRQANLTVRAQGESDPRTAGMATTLDAAVLRQDGRDHWMHGVHVGDGIALVQRGGKLTVLTHAHTLASELVAHGRLSASQSEDHPGASTLLRAVGLDRTISPDLWTERAEPGTRFLLASDGLLAALGSRRLKAELVKFHDVHPQQCVDNLVAVALALGAPDNVTVVVGDVVAAGTAREMVLSRKALERGPVDSRLLPPAEPGERA